MQPRQVVPRKTITLQQVRQVGRERSVHKYTAIRRPTRPLLEKGSWGREKESLIISNQQLSGDLQYQMLKRMRNPRRGELWDKSHENHLLAVKKVFRRKNRKTKEKKVKERKTHSRDG